MSLWSQAFTKTRWPLGAAAALLAALAGCGPVLAPRPQGGANPVRGVAVTLAAVRANTPRLADAGYRTLPGSPWPGLTLYGRPRADGIQLLLGSKGAVVAVRGVFPAVVGLQPWYDQAPGAMPASSGTQAAHSTPPPRPGRAGGRMGPGSSAVPAASVSAGGAAAPAVAPVRPAASRATPRPLGPSAAGAAAIVAGRAPVASAPAPGAHGGATHSAGGGHPAGSAAGGPAASGSTATTSGSESAPAPSVYTQTIWLAPPPSLRAHSTGDAPPPPAGTYRTLLPFNPTLQRAHRLTPFQAGVGWTYGHRGFGLALAVGRRGRITGVVGFFPLQGGYQPMFDQPPGAFLSVPSQGLQGYTQHIAFVPPSSIR
jgi:hypothetical protein